MSRPDQPPEPEPTYYDQRSYGSFEVRTPRKRVVLKHGLTDPQARAMKWMYHTGYVENGATGILDKNGRVIINGISRRSTEPVTWLRLILKELVCTANERIGLTAKGIEWCEEWIPKLYGNSQLLTDEESNYEPE